MVISNVKKGKRFSPGEEGGWQAPNLCRNRLSGNTEPGCGKLKKGKGFLKPNFEPGPNRSSYYGGLYENFQKFVRSTDWGMRREKGEYRG
jgi:hypothetical protein